MKQEPMKDAEYVRNEYRFQVERYLKNNLPDDEILNFISNDMNELYYVCVFDFEKHRDNRNSKETRKRIKNMESFRTFAYGGVPLYRHFYSDIDSSVSDWMLHGKNIVEMISLEMVSNLYYIPELHDITSMMVFVSRDKRVLQKVKENQSIEGYRFITTEIRKVQ